MSGQAEQLLRQFNQWRRKTAHFQSQATLHPMKDLAAVTKKENRIDQLNRLIAWCNGEGIDPERWIYTMFSARNWKHCPPFQTLIPKNKSKSKTYQLYFQSRETPEYDRVVHQRVEVHQMQSGQRYDPNRDLGTVSENLKRQYLSEGRANECMENMNQTLGYHPRSIACARCPVQGLCANRLQSVVSFNIIALRRGDITAEQAYYLGELDVAR
jgi:hypothetical protein